MEESQAAAPEVSGAVGAGFFGFSSRDISVDHSVVLFFGVEESSIFLTSPVVGGNCLIAAWFGVVVFVVKVL